MKIVMENENGLERDTNEPIYDKTNNMTMRPAKTQISLGIRPVWSESSLSAWRNLESLATHWSHSKHSDQTGRMPRLITLTKDNTTSNNTSNASKPGATQFSIGSFELVY